MLLEESSLLLPKTMYDIEAQQLLVSLDDETSGCNNDDEIKTTWEQQQQMSFLLLNKKDRKRSSHYGTTASASDCNSNSATANKVYGESSNDDDNYNKQPHNSTLLFQNNMEEQQEDDEEQTEKPQKMQEHFDTTSNHAHGDNDVSSKATVTNDDEAKVDWMAVYSSLNELTDELVEIIDTLFHKVDRDVVTVKLFHKYLEDELGHPMPKNLKALVKQRLLGLLTGDVKSSSVETTHDDSSLSEENSVTSDEDDTLYDEKEDEEKKQTKSTNRKKIKVKGGTMDETTSKRPRKTRSSKKKPSSSIMEQQLKTIRQKQAEEEQVRKEELAGAGEQKIHEEDMRRQEAIAARFESGQEESKIVREQHRKCVLEQLLLKKRSVLFLTEDDFQPAETWKDQLSTKVPTSALVDLYGSADDESEDNSSSDDSELDIIPPSSSRSSMVDELLNPNGMDFVVDKRKSNSTPTGTSSLKNSRVALRNSLRSKAIVAGNTWLARELGYKTQEEHLKDCRLAESQRKDVLRKQEVKKQIMISTSLLKENTYLTDDFIPDDDESDDEEMLLAREIHAEKQQESSQLPISDDASHQDDDHHHEIHNGSQLVRDEPLLVDGSQFLKVIIDGSQLVYDDQRLDNEAQDVESVYPGSQLVCDDPIVDEKVLQDYAESQFVRPMDRSQLNDTSKIVVTNAFEKHNGGSQLVNDSLDYGLISDRHDSNKTHDNIETKVQSDDSIGASNGASPRKSRAEGWKAMLLKEAEKLKKKKKKNRSVSGMIEEEAEEEEDDIAAGGLEDFGFGVINKKKEAEEDDDEEEDVDLDGIVDELSDNEGDEEEGARGRKMLQEKEEKEQHKELLRRMRDGYDGRRGGIAAGGGARGVHRFDELVAADDRGEAKRLGLLNDDELLESDDDEEQQGDNASDEDDEAILIDKMLKDRFLHRTDEDRLFSENDSEDEIDDLVGESESQNDNYNPREREEIMEQLMEKRFAKNARRNRIIEIYGEGSQSRIIDEDESLKNDLKCIKTISKKRSLCDVSSKKPFFNGAQGSLSIALMASRQKKKKTSFLSGKSPITKNSAGSAAAVAKSVSLSHVVFQSTESQHASSQLENNSSRSRRCVTTKHNSKMTASESSSTTASLWSRVSSNGFKR